MVGRFVPKPGVVVGGEYEIVRPLGAGGMASVYVAIQRSTRRERALKIMAAELVDNADLRRRFEQEAVIGAEIESEHIVEVVGAGIDAASGVPWLAMELLQGEDLQKHLAKRRVLPHDEVVSIFEQLTHAVAAAHDKQIVHRDLKPDNIFLVQTRRAGAPLLVKVLDFGIAKLLGQVKGAVTGTLGTPHWMAPEQAQTGGQITPAADIWSLGLIAFRCLSGKYYWKALARSDAVALDVLREVIVDPLEPASQRAHALGGAPLPPAFDAWFARCVERDPTRRFPDAAVLFEELRSVFGGSSSAPQRAPELATPPQHDPPRPALGADTPARTQTPHLIEAGLELAHAPSRAPPPMQLHYVPTQTRRVTPIVLVASCLTLVAMLGAAAAIFVRSAPSRSRATSPANVAPLVVATSAGPVAIPATPGRVELVVETQGTGADRAAIEAALVDACGPYDCAACYHTLLEANRELRAIVGVQFVLRTDGSVVPSGMGNEGAATIRVMEGAVDEHTKRLADCMSAPTRTRAKFPRPTSDATVVVTWFFGFDPDGATVVVDAPPPMRGEVLQAEKLAADLPRNPKRYAARKLTVSGFYAGYTARSGVVEIAPTRDVGASATAIRCRTNVGAFPLQKGDPVTVEGVGRVVESKTDAGTPTLDLDLDDCAPAH